MGALVTARVASRTPCSTVEGQAAAVDVPPAKLRAVLEGGLVQVFGVVGGALPLEVEANTVTVDSRWVPRHRLIAWGGAQASAAADADARSGAPAAPSAAAPDAGTRASCSPPQRW